MRKLALILLAVLLASGSLTTAENVHQLYRIEDDPSFEGYMPNMIVVQLDESFIPTLNQNAFKSANALAGVVEFDAVARRFGITRIDKKFPGVLYDAANSPQRQALTRFFRVHVDDADLDEVIAAYERLPMVTRAYKIPVHSMDATPNDPSFSTQWNYWDTYGVDADLAWDMQTGDATVVVGILDSGVKYDHGDLGGSDPPGPSDNVTNGNIWVNDQEIPGNGYDDDANGYDDDVIGWDFVEAAMRCNEEDCTVADNDPSDAVGHGTHVSGTAAAINNNGYRVCGVAGGYNDGTQSSTANGVKILPCRIGWARGSSGSVSMEYAAEAMVYVGDLKARGVNVAAINCSWGSSETADLAAAVAYLVSEDVLIVVSAGNSNSPTPAYLPSLPECLSVGATDISGNPSTFSNYGSWVEVAAPGTTILSSWNGDGDQTRTMSGTSMSAPHVVGVAALLESTDPSLSRQDKWDIICDPDNVKPYNMTKYVGVGIVSAKKCLDAIEEPCTDPPVADFSGDPTSGDYPLTVDFTDLSTNNPTSWEWDFGDGSEHVYTQHPSHQYTYADNFTVTLTATNDCGYDVEQKVAYISVTEPTDPPVAAFSADPLTGPIELQVTFDDQSTNGPTSWTWDFGDGSPVSHDQDPVHTYTYVDTFTVTLIVSNAFGADTLTKDDYISTYEAPDNSLHVDSIYAYRGTVGRNCNGRVGIWIKDQDHQPVAGADVYVTATGPVGGTGNALTDDTGYVAFQTSYTKSCTGEWCFEVTDVILAGYTYDQNDNDMTKVCESGIVFKSDPIAGGDVLAPTEYGLSQNYPNPFNPTTDISFSLPAPGHVSLEIYNIRGQKVTTLVDGFRSAGIHTVRWDASRLASGIYLYRMKSGDYVEQRKMTLLK
ncbi:MAG: S8 family serine peptidase [Candidatus Zixiibacteriota bacterium]|nr:MAG: S8 family serine peptidase [candidate division Zixibacteria bacterium]